MNDDPVIRGFEVAKAAAEMWQSPEMSVTAD
jgi:hypothetical protein